MKIRLVAILIHCLSVTSAFAEEKDLIAVFGDEDMVSLATGKQQPIAVAPAVATVITSKDIETMGALDLDEILESVPGLHVATSANSSNPIYTIRGIYSEFNPQVLMLINGIPITNVYLGNRGQMWGGMPVKNIERIEVIRGPGSAVYGADAFAGVINIITKTADQLDGTTVGVRTGSFNTADTWLLHGTKVGNWDLAFAFEYHTTDGSDEIVEADLQTVFDGFFGTSASLAPGPVNTGVDALDTRLDLSNDLWQFRLGYQSRKDLQTNAGVAETLDPTGTNNGERLNADVTYHNKEFSQNWDLKVQLSYFDVAAEADLILFPPGTLLPIGSDGNIGNPLAGDPFVLFTDGFIGNPDVYENHTRLGVDTFYSGFDNHSIRVGFGANHSELRGEETKNFGPGVIDGTEGVIDGTLTDVTGTPFVFISNEERDNSYIFAQDEWSIAPDWKLTAGVRFDDYSDFGNTTNPRLALVWKTNYNLTSKILYGRAFRPPSFAEQFNINNPVALGNPDLDPETIDTLELAFDYAASSDVRFSLNIFSYEMQDIIRFVPDPLPASSKTAQNTGAQTGQGFEWELKWDINDDTTFLANYAYQDSEDDDTRQDAPNAPQQQIYLRAYRNFASKWSLGAQLNHIAERKRAAGDLRPEIDDYAKLDLSLRRHAENHDGIEIGLHIKNATDEDIREPTPAPGSIPNDLPLAGRAYFADLSYHW